ncbi:MliC family protein [Aureimonas sp. AU22]|uniref:MliC family protein n=1 Tax=Aureimonas sp. AU22 TaxID=1638162 RepID=UPI000781EA99|nr:MliC family protein [Aureimonas sp. AU22]
MKTALTLSALMLASATVAQADPLTLDLPGTPERMRFTYECSDGVSRVVDYVNLPDNDLAIVEAGSSRRLFVGVIAASGAKYAAGAQVWWSKGTDASLLDVTKGDAPVAECQQIKRGSRG